MAEDNCKVVVMEVSSQSLMLHRVDGCDFDIAVFTNFSEDHISPKEHKDDDEGITIVSDAKEVDYTKE
jgi:UDP-N-acetylmuramoyl-L-alanyl-D-glutamate--2,6-diaminopimelate ligase